MNLERFEKAISSLTDMFKDEGFYKSPDKFEIDVFGKFIDYHSQAIIITSRLEEDITEHDSLMKYIIKCAMEKREISETEIQKHGLTLPKLMLDLSDFFIYTRIFLDTLTVCIKRSFKSAGRKNWDIMEHSMNCLLNEHKMQRYKDEIYFSFFTGLEKKLTWIGDFRESRNGLVHKYHHFAFTTTREGDLGYDIADRIKTSWGTDTVKSIVKELQRTIEGLTDLMEYLLENLPRSI
jgi:hypothetical protein